MSYFLSKSDAISAIKSAGVEEQFLKMAGLNSLDELDPANFEGYDSFRKILVKPSSSTVPEQTITPATKSDGDAAPPKSDISASSILLPFLTTGIVRENQLRPSFFYPSAFMMYYIIHQMNETLCDKFYFLRFCPDYHPFVLRLYYGVVFYVQVLRATKTVTALTGPRHQFLTRFLEAFDPACLPIAGPLIPLFKTLASSQPELSNFGKVYPALPTAVGPVTANTISITSAGVYGLPFMNGIFALLESLNSVINGTTPSYPKKNWTPFRGATGQVTFAKSRFSVERAANPGATPPVTAVTWADEQAWLLTRPGVEYPCEASAKLNEAFAERYENFNFPTFDDATNISDVEALLGMTYDLEWFSLVRLVAEKAARYTEGSGTLKDCSPHGLRCAQTIVQIQAPSTLPVKPTYAETVKASYVSASRLGFAYRLSTTARQPDQMSETMSAFGQTHVRVYQTHPWQVIRDIGTSGTANAGRPGPFWALRPIYNSPVDDSAFMSIKEYIDKATKEKL